MRHLIVLLLLTRPALAQERPGADRIREIEKEISPETPPAPAAKIEPPDPIVLSGALCYYQGQRVRGLHEIAEQRKYAKIGGAINYTAIWQAQMFIRRQDKRIAAVRAEMRASKVRPLPCNKGEVYNLANCIYQRATGGDEDEVCSGQVTSELIAKFDEHWES